MTKSAPSAALEAVLSRRLIFVAGKGGTGKTTVAAALALRAAESGKRVLLIEADAKGDLPGAFGAAPVGFTPEVVHRNISVLAMSPEASMQEYLHIFFKVPRFVRITPISRVFDFIATGVPGPREMVITGKIAYEERATIASGQPKWDLVVVDAMASGHVVSHLRAAREGLRIMQSGMVRGQLEWMDKTIRDHRRTTTVITSLAEEMSVKEAIDLTSQIKKKAGVHVGACFVNRTAMVSEPSLDLAGQLTKSPRQNEIETRLGGSPRHLDDGLQLIARIARAQRQYLRELEDGIEAPVAKIPVLVAKPGLATTKVVAAALGNPMS